MLLDGGSLQDHRVFAHYSASVVPVSESVPDVPDSDAPLRLPGQKEASPGLGGSELLAAPVLATLSGEGALRRGPCPRQELSC